MTVSMEVHDPAEVGMSASRLAHAATLMDRQFETGRSPMLVVLVARHGKVVFTHAVGDARPGGPPVTVDSVFPIASQTKPMTAAVVMALAERGLVGIMERASALLPELADQPDVLVYHLLTHTSGWNEEDQAATRQARLDEAIASIPDGVSPLTHIMLWPGWDVPLRTEPGALMQYCNFNYTLLGEIVRRATGGSLDAAMREYLFDPIGMTSSAVIVDADLEDRVIERPAGIPFGPDHPFSAISFNDPLWAASDDGASGVHASMPDLMRFWQMILDGGVVGDTRVLSADAVRVMTTDQIPGTPAEALGLSLREASWGFGFGVAGHERWPRFGGGTTGAATIRHGGAGGIGGWIDPVSGVVVAYVEVVTEVNEFGMHLTWVGHRVEDIVNAAVLD